MSPVATVYFDLVDPVSWLIHRALAHLEPEGIVPEGGVRWVGLELALPPHEFVDLGAPEWDSALAAVEAGLGELGEAFTRPRFTPWSRKAHELLLHAEASGSGDPVREALFTAHFVDGKDLGRVDVLTEIGLAVGLDYTETKAVLDVDRYTEAVGVLRAEAMGAGVDRIPTLRSAVGSLVGPVGIDDLRSLFSRTDGPPVGD